MTTTRPREAPQEARNVRLCTRSDDFVVRQVAAPAAAPAATAPAAAVEAAAAPAPAPASAPEPDPIWKEVPPLSTAVEPEQLRSYLSRRFLDHGSARDIFTSLLKRWICHCINFDLSCVTVQNKMAQAAATGYRGMIFKYDCSAIIKCTSTYCQDRVFPTVEEFHSNYPKLGSLVYLIRSNRSCSQTPCVEKFTQRLEQGEDQSMTIHVVALWADVLTLVPDDLWTEALSARRVLRDAEMFRTFCRLPSVKDVPKLSDVVITGPIARRLLGE